MHAIGLRGTVAYDVIAHLSPWRLDCLVNFTSWNLESLRNNLEVIDEGLHLSLHLLPVGQHHMRSIGFDRPLWHSIERLAHDPDRLPQFLHAAHVASEHVAFL